MMSKTIIPKLGKKGFTYMLVTSLLVVVLLAIFYNTNNYSYQDKESVQQIRIRAMNDFVKNLNLDIHRATYIAAFRTMLALEDHVTTTGLYLTDINSSFKETFFYGTINGTESAIMANSTFEDYLIKVSTLSETTGIILDMNVTDIFMTQSDPWLIDIYVSLNITALDVRGTTAWHMDKTYLTQVPIENLRDPIYSKNTFNRMPNTVVRTPNSTLVDVDNDTTNLITHINRSYYIASTHAPTFVMRFEGRTDSDPNGIESIVDIRALSDQDIEVFEDRIKVDYMYFNDLSGNKVCNVEGIPSDKYFVITLNRLDSYQITGINYSTSCP